MLGEATRKAVGPVALVEFELPDGQVGYVVRIGRTGHWGGDSLLEAESEFARLTRVSGVTRD